MPKSSCDLRDRRKSAICLAVAIQLMLVMSLFLADCRSAFGQATFAPPPLPTQVRGIYDPAQPPPSPAVPQPVRQPVAPTPSAVIGTSPITPTTAQPIEGGEIVARVNGQIILASDVLWQVNQIIETNRDRIPAADIDKARRALLQQHVMGMIDTKLLYADFRRNIPPENIPDIEKNLEEPFETSEIPRLIEVLGVKDRLELVEKLEHLESSLADLQRQFTERTIAGEWLRQRVPKSKPVTHDQMLEYYQSHLVGYDYPSQVKWEEIAIRFDRTEGGRDAAWREMAELGNDIWQRVSKHPGLRGPIFTELAKQKSHGFTAGEGGQHDWTTKDALRSETLNEALFSLKVGQLSNILETETGFHIIRVLERKEAGRTPFSESQVDIRKQLEGGGKQGLVMKELEKLREHCRVWTVFDGDLSGPRLGEKMQQRRRR